MVNPYQPSETKPSTERENPLTRLEKKNRINFAGGFRGVLGIGAFAGLLMVGVGYAADSMFINPFPAFLLIFFLLTLTMMFCLRGVRLSGASRFGCAVALTPIAMILFVPVCAGGAFTFFAIDSSVLGSKLATEVVSNIVLGVFFMIGFMIVAGGLAFVIRDWSAKRLALEKPLEIDSAISGNIDADKPFSVPTDPHEESDSE